MLTTRKCYKIITKHFILSKISLFVFKNFGDKSTNIRLKPTVNTYLKLSDQPSEKEATIYFTTCNNNYLLLLIIFFFHIGCNVTKTALYETLLMIRIINLIPMRNQPQRLKPQRLKILIQPQRLKPQRLKINQATQAKIRLATKALRTCHKGTKETLLYSSI
jgi:hypothetical protein